MFFTSSAAHPIFLLAWAGVSYIGMLVFGLPYVQYLEKKGKLTVAQIALGSVVFGAIFGVIIGFGSFVGAELNLSRGLSFLFSFFALIAMLFGALYGGIVGVTFGLVRYAAIKQQAT